MSSPWPLRRIEHLVVDRGLAMGPFGSNITRDNFVQAGVPVLRGSSLVNNRFSDSDVVFVTPEKANDLKSAQAVRGDLVFTHRGTLGQVALIPENSRYELYVVSQSQMRARLDDSQIYPRFAHYWFCSREGQAALLANTSQVGVPAIARPLASLREVQMPVPPLAEQRRIAGVLGALDDLIEVNRGLALDCEGLAQSLASMASATTTLSSFTTWGGLSTVKPAGQVDHYSLPAFDDGRNPERVDGTLIKSSKQQISQPCVLVARLNPHIPRVWMVYPDAAVSSLASTEFVPIRAEGLPTEVVYAVCSAPNYLDQMNGLVTGTTGSHQRVDKDALMSVEVPDARTLSAQPLEAITLLVKQAHALRVEIRELSSTRDELLPLLMSGRVRVADGVAA